MLCFVRAGFEFRQHAGPDASPYSARNSESLRTASASTRERAQTCVVALPCCNAGEPCDGKSDIPHSEGEAASPLAAL